MVDGGTVNPVEHTEHAPPSSFTTSAAAASSSSSIGTSTATGTVVLLTSSKDSNVSVSTTSCAVIHTLTSFLFSIHEHRPVVSSSF